MQNEVTYCNVLNNLFSIKEKFIYVNDEKFYIKGVTYGTFAPDENGNQFPDEQTVEVDFSMMKISGINTVRTYTVPPLYLLDIAEKQNLKVMVGLPWEQHITFLDSSERQIDIINRVKIGVEQCNAHSAVLCFAVGNEIPAPIVRWYGPEKIQRFIKKLYLAVKEVNHHSLVTYVNYPTTEYLDLPFLDFYCFNVYLETPQKLNSYILRLQNLYANKPLVLAEIGLDSMRNGIEKQAEVLNWQVEMIYGLGCAGMFVFAWTDEWWRGGFEIEDWDFGLVTRKREPKPALEVVSLAMQNVPVKLHKDSPFFSVVICSYNGSATIKQTIENLLKLDYPSYEVIVVNDGSTDNFAEIVAQFPVKLISTPNRGLSSARNTGMYNAKGDIIAYIDDDAYPDEHWLHYLAYAYIHTTHASIGGPNIAPPEDGPTALCVANAPGGPVHVLLSDEIAEHIPGCNLSVRAEALRKIGGFDPVFRAAGDDVDVCWRLQDAGYTIGFHPSAMVWHHRRSSLKAYWKQQQGYGKAEALLEAKWPEKYNSFGHLSWVGRIYGNGFTKPIQIKKGKVFHGTWGTALFQSVYQPADGLVNSIPLMPEWYLFTGLFGLVGVLGFIWSPLLWSWLVFGIFFSIVVIQAVISAIKNSGLSNENKNIRCYALITVLHIVQPIARLYGRLKYGLTPWRRRGAGFSFAHLFSLWPKVYTHWSETWKSTEDWLLEIENNLLDMKTRFSRGGDFDRWDIKVNYGFFTSCRGLLTIEEHGAQKQMLKFKCSTKFATTPVIIAILLGVIGAISLLNNQFITSGVLLAFFAILSGRLLVEKAFAMNSLVQGFKLLAKSEKIDDNVNTFKGNMVMGNKETKQVADIELIS